MSKNNLVFFVGCFICMVASMDLDSPFTAPFLDDIVKSKQNPVHPQCGVQTVNRTKPFFFGVTDLKCLNIEARLKNNGYNNQDIQNLREQFPNLVGKRSVETVSEPTTDEKQQLRSPYRSTFRPIHRWIFYDGYFIEFGAGSGNIPGRLPEVTSTSTSTTTPSPRVLYPQLEFINLKDILEGNSTKKISNKTETKSNTTEGHQNITAEEKQEVSLSNANMQTLYPKNGDICAARMESEVSGYSSIPLECLYKCARSFVAKYGKYNLIKNNCHRFANILSDILCTDICPEWCK